jgi:predicted RNA-binding protein (virulence factor B family)
LHSIRQRRRKTLFNCRIRIERNNMIELGKYKTLEFIKKTYFGFYLSKPGSDNNQRVLLPIKEAGEDTKLNDKINVFIYKDSEDREIATTSSVPLTLGGLATLKVKEVTNIGAFLDWGLMKDLLLPFKEQTYTVEEGDSVLVSLYVDKSNRLCATMKVYDYLLADSKYQKEDLVTGVIYDIIDAFGAFVAVDNLYSALIPNKEIFKPLNIGNTITARVVEVRKDGKLTLSLREKSHLQIDSDADLILNELKEAGGFLPYHDKSDAKEIQTKFMISKNAFKRALGRLYKDGSITILEDGISLKK